MDRIISDKEKNKTTIKKWIYPILIIVVLLVVYKVSTDRLQTKMHRSNFLIAKVSLGDLEKSFVAQGQVIPQKEISINAPITTQIKSVFLENGAELKKGDAIIELNNEFLRLTYESQHDNLLLKKNNIKKSSYTFDKRIKDLTNDSKIFELRIQEQKAKLASLKIMFDMGSNTKEDIKKAEVSLQIAKLEKNKIDDELLFQKRYNRIEKENLQLEVLIQSKSLRELKTKLDNTVLKSPISGNLMWINKNIGKQVNEGENIARIADLSTFKIDAHCSDRYNNQISIGTAVRFKTEQANITGTINNIDPTVDNNQLKFDVTLDNPSQTGIRAYYKGELRVITGIVKQVKLIKRGIGVTGAKTQDLWLIRDHQAIKKSFKIGGANSEFVEIIGDDLQIGDEIIISDMKAFEKKTKFEIHD